MFCLFAAVLSTESNRLLNAASVKKIIGFDAEAKGDDLKPGEYLAKILPEDLLRFGLIPEFIGRLPVISSLQPLDADALVEILTQPKNALVKQYKKLLELDEVELEFTDQALVEIAKKAIERKTGARGLRSIIEGIMLDVMFDLPSRDDVVTCVIHEKCITESQPPTLKTEDGSEIELAQKKPKESA